MQTVSFPSSSNILFLSMISLDSQVVSPGESLTGSTGPRHLCVGPQSPGDWWAGRACPGSCAGFSVGTVGSVWGTPTFHGGPFSGSGQFWAWLLTLQGKSIRGPHFQTMDGVG